MTSRSELLIEATKKAGHVIPPSPKFDYDLRFGMITGSVCGSICGPYARGEADAVMNIFQVSDFRGDCFVSIALTSMKGTSTLNSVGSWNQ